MKMLKQGLDHSNKMIFDQRNIIEENMKEYCTKLLNELQNGAIAQMKQFDVDLRNVRVENGKYHIEARKQLEEVMSVVENVNKIKNDYISEWANEKNLFFENRLVFSEMKELFGISEKEHEEINQSMKVKIFFKLNNLFVGFEEKNFRSGCGL